MLSEALPIYSGGLGNAAGDHLKAASDLGVPLIGVGLLYQRGYFPPESSIRTGRSRPTIPITIRAIADRAAARRQWGVAAPASDLPGYPIWLRVWHVQRRPAEALPSRQQPSARIIRLIAASPATCTVADRTLRLMQELVLGIGGWRLLAELGIEPEVCHLNEGHAAFAALERARSFMRSARPALRRGAAATRAGNLFTTHTPVEAGFDRFPPELIELYLQDFARQRGRSARGSCWRSVAASRTPIHGKFQHGVSGDPRGCGAVNGVSRLHGRSAGGFSSPRFRAGPQAEVPVGHITNGVHMPTWDSPEADALWTTACGKGRWRDTPEISGQDSAACPTSCCGNSVPRRSRLIEFARRPLRGQHRAPAGATLRSPACRRRRVRPETC